MAEMKMPERQSSLNPLSLPGNSNVSKEHPQDGRPKQQKIVKGSVTVKKQGLGKKFADLFFGEDITDVKSYILRDVLVPTIKATISDVVGGGVEMLLFGRVSGRNRGGGYPTQSRTYTPYSGYSNQNNQTGRPNAVIGGRYAVQEIIFNSRGEAEDVLDAMIDALRRYDGIISVADFYDMVGVLGSFTDNAWGWTDLGNASVRRVRDGYVLMLPKPVSVK